MAKKIPTAAEVREYKERKYREIKYSHNYTVTGPQFPGENIWSRRSTLMLLEAAEAAGVPDEVIWKLCSKIASTIHAPVTKKEYERMLPFAQNPQIVDVVLKYLDTYGPDYVDENLSSLFDIIGYYYCVALISLSDYRQEDCIKMLWDKVYYHIENYDKKNGGSFDVLLRNMKVLEASRPYLTPMKEKMMEVKNNK